jgi:hypothetical protein
MIPSAARWDGAWLGWRSEPGGMDQRGNFGGPRAVPQPTRRPQTTWMCPCGGETGAAGRGVGLVPQSAARLAQLQTRHPTVHLPVGGARPKFRLESVPNCPSSPHRLVPTVTRPSSRPAASA